MSSCWLPIKWFCASFSDELQSPSPQENMVFSKKELLLCSSVLPLLPVLLLLLFLGAAVSHSRQLLLAKEGNGGLSGGAVMEGL